MSDIPKRSGTKVASEVNLHDHLLLPCAATLPPKKALQHLQHRLSDYVWLVFWTLLQTLAGQNSHGTYMSWRRSTGERAEVVGNLLSLTLTQLLSVGLVVVVVGVVVGVLAVLVFLVHVGGVAFWLVEVDLHDFDWLCELSNVFGLLSFSALALVLFVFFGLPCLATGQWSVTCFNKSTQHAHQYVRCTCASKRVAW